MLAADYAMAASHINGFPVQNNAVVVAGPADASAEAGSHGVGLPQDATWCSPDKKSLLDLVTGRDPAAAEARAMLERPIPREMIRHTAAYIRGTATRCCASSARQGVL